jgi:hypothetical protein
MAIRLCVPVQYREEELPREKTVSKRDNTKVLVKHLGYKDFLNLEAAKHCFVTDIIERQ